MNTNKLETSKVMQAHIEQCKVSGLKIREYCRLHNIKASNYYYWLKKQTALDVLCKGSFLQLSPILDSTNIIEVILLNGTRICFSQLVSADYLKQIIA